MPQPAHKRQHTPWQQRVGEGALDAHKGLMKRVVEPAIEQAPKRIGKVMKAIPGAPKRAYQLGTFLGSDDKLRTVVGWVGGGVGGAAGGALGAAAGGINAPIGAYLGGVAGEELATDIYDDHKEAIHKRLHQAGDWVDDNLRKMNETRKWFDGRNSDLRRR